ncbi:hypothetical protein RHMOL_Rhmol10G0101000 [Rhododendron molle]|uniref:Uncharacterized protein n=1 Tax=Rhododendron molle TaxID=49168 RepID=A0ACC0M1V8_RHOML|nr:hypothetical protein RHMOL_Rhmol10G0101000 [Rhododendron molle]
MIDGTQLVRRYEEAKLMGESSCIHRFVLNEGAISQGSQSTIRAAEHLVSLLGLGLASSLLLLAKFLYLELDWTLMKGGYQNDFIWQYVCAFTSLSLRECGKIIFLYGTIIDGLCKKGKTRMAARWLCKKGTISVNVLADALTKEGNAKEVKEVIELLKEMEVGPLSPPIVIIKGFWRVLVLHDRAYRYMKHCFHFR